MFFQRIYVIDRGEQGDDDPLLSVVAFARENEALSFIGPQFTLNALSSSSDEYDLDCSEVNATLRFFDGCEDCLRILRGVFGVHGTICSEREGVSATLCISMSSDVSSC